MNVLVWRDNLKSWEDYIKEYINTEFWGFIALDYYIQKKSIGDHKEPSQYIDYIISMGLNDETDPVIFHKVLLSICVQLLGNDFTDIIGKSISMLEGLEKYPNDEQLEMISSHYEIYGKREDFQRRLKFAGFSINSSNAQVRKAEEKEMNFLDGSNAPIYLFYSYSHADEKYRKMLEKHLALLKKNGFITEWHDRKILPGSNIKNEINENLRKSKIILLLVSADFIASEYCYGFEMKFALEEHDKKQKIVIPIILKDCDWQKAPFCTLLALPTDGRPVTSKKWKNQDEAFADVAKGIRQVVESLKEG